MASWYYAQNGQTLGPVDDDFVRSLVSSGTLLNDAPLMPVGGSTWGTVGQYAGQLGMPMAAPSPFGAPGQTTTLPPSPSFGAPSPGFGAPVGGYAGGGAAPAEFGQRAIAFLIDYGIVFAGYVAVVIVAVVLGAIADVLGGLVGLVGYLAVIAFSIWNLYIKQGKTGQSFGKEKQGIKLVKTATGQPLGAGMTFVRYLVFGAIGGATCGLFIIVDLLSPLWNNNRRYTDQILGNDVVKV
jgi:uncharacterized RDD family membrane protein YckC